MGNVHSAERRRNEWDRARLALVAALLVTVSLLSGGGSDEAAAEPAAKADGAAPARLHRITLITGDTVEYTDSGNGRRAVAIDAAPRPDGAPVEFETIGSRDDYFVIPSDAEPYLAAGVLDRALFNVADLVHDGLDDASTDAVPVIVDYSGRLDRGRLAGKATALPGVLRVVPVRTTSMAGVRVSHDHAADFWQAIATTTASRPARKLAGGVARITLDRTMRVALDRSVPMIGAPAGWAAGLDGKGVKVGVVDTGIDLEHPDLAGNVAASANFTEEPDVSDTSGHGTHVASTIAGSGKASGGTYRGVAPGAELVVAKVFDASGTAPESQVMAGMEWAATHGARIVNLSLGGAPTDGTDPISTLVDELTARTGALFVVASGNLGGNRSVTSPGAATSALTVGAVDKQDALADFAGKGPRLGDAAVKPEIVAPGVAISAARAAGTAMGTPVDDNYTTASGTSMATPHVSGAAAILAQQHPDWPALRLKDAVVTTATEVSGTWYERGAGRVDVARLIGQQVTATATLSLGRLSHDAGPATGSITYSNDGDRPLSLRLTQAVRGWNGGPAPAGAVRLAATILEVPAGGEAGLAVTVDPKLGESGAYGGMVTATSADGSISLRTPLSYYVPPPSGSITVRMRDSTGQPVTNRIAAVLNESAGDGNDPFDLQPLRIVPVNTTIEVPQGNYSVSGSAREETVTRHRWTALSATEIPVTGEGTVVTLDARDAVPIGVTTPRPTDQQDRTVALRRHLPDTAQFVEWQFIIGADATWQVYATPAAPAKKGTVSFQDYWTLSERQLTMRVRGGGLLQPTYDAATTGAALAGTRSLPLVWANRGRPEDFAAADTRGKLALVAIAEPEPGVNPTTATFQAAKTAAANAADAGSAGVVVYVDAPGAVPVAGLTNAPVAQLALSHSEGDTLRRRTANGPVTIDLRGRSEPRFMYNLSYHDDNGIPADHVWRVRPATLVRIHTRYHADRPGVQYTKQWTAYPPVPGGLAQRRTSWTGPAQWTEYIGPVSDQVAWQRRTTQSAVDAQGWPIADLTMFAENVFRTHRPHRSHERWFAAPLRNGALTLQPDHPVLVDTTTKPDWRRQCAFCRGGGDPDRFVPALHWMDGNAGHFVTIWQNGRQYFDTTTARLYRDGTEIPADGSDPFGSFPMFRLPEEPARYRLEMVDEFPAAQRGGPSLALFQHAPRTETIWEFTSQRPTGAVPPGYGCGEPCAFQPLIQLGLQLDLDLNNEAPADGDHQFVIIAGHHVEADADVELTDLNVRYSTDEGETWQPADVQATSAGQYLVTVHHPPVSATNGYVWLRTQARDTAGNSVDQTVRRAYALHD